MNDQTDDIRDNYKLVSVHLSRIIIAVGGRMGVGKDTFVNMLMDGLAEQHSCHQEDQYDSRFMHRIAFADPIKQLVCDTFDVERSWINAWKRMANAPPGYERSVRHILQHVGDLRLYKSDVWVNKLLRNMPEQGIVFVTDVRFENELKVLKKLGAFTLLIKREPALCNPAASSGQVFSQQHNSELAAYQEDDFDHVVLNNGSVEELRSKACGVIAAIEKVFSKW